jgi:predicted Zn-ribbon and HTH transcriptional regulator
MLHKQKKCKNCGKMFLEIRKSDLCPECMAMENGMKMEDLKNQR